MRTLFKLPNSYGKLCVSKCCADFRAATSLRAVQMPAGLVQNQVLVRNIAVGINASDLNYVSGVYRRGLEKELGGNPGCGFEALGVVVAVPEENSAVSLGSVVLVSSYCAFAEYQVASRSNCFVLPGGTTKPVSTADEFNCVAENVYHSHHHYLPLPLSGATALLSLSVAFRMLQATALTSFPLIQDNEAPRNSHGLCRTSQKFNVLVTAAAGAFGHLLTQLLCYYMPASTILAVTSSKTKGQWIEKHCFPNQSGKRAVLCYNESSMDDMLHTHCASGAAPLNMIFDTVGGETLQSLLRHASNKSVTMVIGSTSQYANSNWNDVIRGSGGSQPKKDDESALSISSRLLTRSASMVGFFLPHYKKHIPHAIDHLAELTDQKAISPQVDQSTIFKGLEDIPSGVEYLYSKKSCGKVIVRLV